VVAELLEVLEDEGGLLLQTSGSTESRVSRSETRRLLDATALTAKGVWHHPH
jgi:hypothetical protein